MNDPLSDILAAMCVTSVAPVRTESSGPYAMRFPAFSHVKFGAVLKGQLEMCPDGAETISLSEGDCYLLTSGTAYVARTAPMRPTDGHEFLARHLDPDGVYRFGEGPVEKVVIGGRFVLDDTGAQWLRLALPAALRIASDDPAAAPLRATLTLLQQEVGGGAQGEHLIVSRLAEILLAQAIRAYLQTSGGTAQSWLAGLTHPALGRALQSFHENLAHGWTIEELARESGMSRSAFAKTFRERTGLTPMDYLSRWRLFRIRSDVIRTERPFAQIAADYGWSSRTACTRAFVRLFGATPRQIKAAGYL